MKPSIIRVFLVDDHPLVRDWLKSLLLLEADFQVVGEADDSASALTGIVETEPDVAVIDLTLKRGSGLDLLKSLRAHAPEVRALVLSMHEGIGDVERTLRAGARGYVMKAESSAQIVPAIRWVHSGRIYAAQEVFSRLTERRATSNRDTPDDVTELLSDRELEVFRRLGDGQSTRRIADELFLSQKTVQTYCARIKEKIGLDDATELSMTAIRWRHARRF